MKRSDCHGTPLDVTLDARLSNAFSHDDRISDELGSEILLNVSRILRGVIIEAFIAPVPISFPEHDDMPDLMVSVSLFGGESMGEK